MAKKKETWSIRFLAHSEDGTETLLCTYDKATETVTTYVNEDVIAKQKDKNTQKASRAVSDIVSQNLNFDLLDI